MFRYWLKHRAPISALLSVVMMAVLIFGFVSPYINTSAENRSRLGVYQNTMIDYDIPQPTKEQLQEIESLSFVTSAFGYYYTESSVEVNGKSVLTKILFSEDLDALENTMYCKGRLVEKADQTYDNPVYVDFAFAQENGVKLGDTLKLSSIEFQVERIYETNAYYTSAIFMPLVGAQKELIESKSTSYSGAFLSVNNISEAESYLNSYKPMGRLKDKSLFDSDAEYQLHYAQWEKTSYANEITSFAARESEISQEDVLPMWVGAAVVIAVMIIFNIMAFFSKMEKGYFTAKKTKRGNTAFFTWTAIEEMLVMACVAAGLFYLITTSMEYYCPSEIYGQAGIIVVGAILASVIVGGLINRVMLNTIKDTKVSSTVSFKGAIKEIESNNTIIVLRDDGSQIIVYIAKDTEVCDNSGDRVKTSELSRRDKVKVTVSMNESGNRVGHCYQIKVLN